MLNLKNMYKAHVLDPTITSTIKFNDSKQLHSSKTTLHNCNCTSIYSTDLPLPIFDKRMQWFSKSP